MKTLFKLKKWLTISDAAKHLTIIFGENVAEADVLRLALDGHLKISVNFVNHAKAKGGRIVPIQEAEWRDFSPQLVSLLPLPKDYNGEEIKVLKGIQLDDTSVLELSNEIVTLDGIYDLAMLGGERHDVEHRYQSLTGGPAVSLQSLEGAFVKSIDGGITYQLQERFDSEELPDLSDEIRNDFEHAIKSKGIDPSDTADFFTNWEATARHIQQECKGGLLTDSDHYYPASDLPEDSGLVVRTDALRELEKALISEAYPDETTLGTKEKTTLLVVIAALCDYSAVKLDGRDSSKKIEDMTAEIGAHVTSDTIRKVLREIPDALERRKK